MRNRLDPWRNLPGEERLLLVSLVVLLPLIGMASRVLGFRRTYRLLDGSGGLPAANGDVSADNRSMAMRWGRLVNIAARHGPYSATCLPQSLALRWLLCRSGMPAEVRVRVGKEGGRMQAHAWVELGGRVINDHSDVDAEYAVYPEFAGRLARPLRTS